jgi:hypothetical protein
MRSEAWATAIRRGDVLLIHPDSRWKPRRFVGTAPWITLSSWASREEIGRAVLRALEESRPQIDESTEIDINERLRARYVAFGVSNEDELMCGAECVGIKRVSGNLIVTPTENGLNLWHKNFRALSDETVVVSCDAKDRDVGEAILTGFDRCS